MVTTYLLNDSIGFGLPLPLSTGLGVAIVSTLAL